jgi:hypothetical protein
MMKTNLSCVGLCARARVCVYLSLCSGHLFHGAARHDFGLLLNREIKKPLCAEFAVVPLVPDR